MVTPFVILSKPRSGSSFLRDMLNSHPDIRVYGELLLPAPSWERPLWEPNDLEFARVFVTRHIRRPRLRATRPYWTMRYLERVFDQPSCRAVGMKLMYEQVRQWPETWAYLLAKRVRVIHLVRRNLLDLFLSDAVREQTGIWHVTNDGRPEMPGKKRSLDGLRIRLDPDELVRSLDHLASNQESFRRWVRLSKIPAIEIEYEQLVAEHELFAGVLAFLGLDPDDWKTLRTGHEKVNTKSHTELIENIDEVEARLSRTPYAAHI